VPTEGEEEVGGVGNVILQQTSREKVNPMFVRILVGLMWFYVLIMARHRHR